MPNSKFLRALYIKKSKLRITEPVLMKQMAQGGISFTPLYTLDCNKGKFLKYILCNIARAYDIFGV